MNAIPMPVQNHSEDVSADSLADEVPLCVDLDGTLILSDILWESLVQAVNKPAVLLGAFWALRNGKAAMKGFLAHHIVIDPAALPYRKDLLDSLRAQHSRGRRLVLVTATHAIIAQQVADMLGIFSGVMATDDLVNLGGENKRKALVAAFGERGFDYIGDHEKDLAIFSSARLSLLADPSPRLRKQTAQLGNLDQSFEHKRTWIKIIPKALRVHQWAKNGLLIVPLITAHQIFNFHAWWNLIIAFISFSLLASATYLINDLHDLPVDRRHKHKCNRPLASGNLPIPLGLLLALVLPIFSFWIAWALLPKLFVLFLAIYTVMTLAYSMNLKQRLIVDTLTLALLYTLRIIAGAVAIGVVLSEWLLMFSLFFFVSLAMLKRAIELDEVIDGKKIPGRGYLPSDLDIIRSVGPSSGLISVLVLGLYINSPAVVVLYHTPQILWLISPLMIYWITRIWFLANRREVNHDPIVFALLDWRSYVFAVLIGAILVLASLDLKKILHF